MTAVPCRFVCILNCRHFFVLDPTRTWITSCLSSLVKTRHYFHNWPTHQGQHDLSHCVQMYSVGNVQDFLVFLMVINLGISMNAPWIINRISLVSLTIPPTHQPFLHCLPPEGRKTDWLIPYVFISTWTYRHFGTTSIGVVVHPR